MGAARVLALQLDFDDAGLLALFGDHQGVLDRLDHGQARHAAQGEAGAGPGVHAVDLELDHAVRRRHPVAQANDAIEDNTLAAAGKAVALLAQGRERELPPEPAIRHFEDGHVGLLGAPDVAAISEQSRLRQCIAILVREPEPGDRKIFRSHVDVQLQVVDRARHDHARTQQFHFCDRRLLGLEQRRRLAQDVLRRVRAFLLDVDHQVGFVHRLGHKRVQHRDQRDERRDAADQPAAVEQGVQVALEIEGRLLVRRFHHARIVGHAEDRRLGNDRIQGIRFAGGTHGLLRARAQGRVAQGRVVAVTAEVSAPGINRLRLRFQFASGVAAT